MLHNVTVIFIRFLLNHQHSTSSLSHFSHCLMSLSLSIDFSKLIALSDPNLFTDYSFIFTQKKLQE